MEKSESLMQEVKAENPMKEWLVNYVGNKLKPEDGRVSVEMIITAMADEFPDFVLALAEENFIRGYQQALYDVDYNPPQEKQENVES
jgi:hypothetical protein